MFNMKHFPELEREQGQIIFVLLLSSSACASLHPFYFSLLSLALLYLFFHFLTFTPPPCTLWANMPSVKMKTYLLFVLAFPAQTLARFCFNRGLLEAPMAAESLY